MNEMQQYQFTDWSELENYSSEVISTVISENLTSRFGQIIGRDFGSHCRVDGTANYKHQIDFHVSFEKAEIFGECKLYNDVVGLQDALCFPGRKTDIMGTRPTNKPCFWLFVTNTDFTWPAKKLLQAHDIKMAQFPCKNDFILRISDISFFRLPGTDFLSLGSNTGVRLGNPSPLNE